MPIKDPIKKRIYNREYMRKWQRDNPEKVKAIELRYFLKDPERRRNQSRRSIEKTRMSLATRPRSETCEICGVGDVRIVLDHNHTTGKFRGWICNHCNSSLGFARDNVDTLYKMINYLNQSRGLVVLNQELLKDNAQQPNITT